MTTPLTDKDIERLEALLAKSAKHKPLPWVTSEKTLESWTSLSIRPTVELINAGINALPALLAEVKRRKAIDEVNENMINYLEKRLIKFAGYADHLGTCERNMDQLSHHCTCGLDALEGGG